MSERDYDVRPVGVEYVCDECGVGLMMHTNMAIMSNPPQYPHHCSDCGAVKNLEQMYPMLKWERVPG